MLRSVLIDVVVVATAAAALPARKPVAGESEDCFEVGCVVVLSFAGATAPGLRLSYLSSELQISLWLAFLLAWLASSAALCQSSYPRGKVFSSQA